MDFIPDLIKNYFLLLLKGIFVFIIQLISYGIVVGRQKDRHQSFFYKIPRIFHIDNIPYHAWTFSIYTSWFIYIITVFFFFPYSYHYTLFCALTLTILLNNCFFVMFPTHYPNHSEEHYAHLLRRQENDIHNKWWHDVFYKKYIKPGSKGVAVAPSAHTSISWTPVLFLLLTESSFSMKSIAFVIWGLSIIATTITTKQHYFFDVLMGFMTGSLSTLCVFYCSSRIFYVVYVMIIFTLITCGERMHKYIKRYEF